MNSRQSHVTTRPDSAKTAAMLERLQDALSRSDRSEVNNVCRELIARQAPLGQTWKSIAKVLQHNGEHLLAIDAIDALLNQSDGAPFAFFEKAVVLSNAGRAESALAILRQLPQSLRQAANVSYLEGNLLTNLGRLEEAASEFRGLVARKPMLGQAWLALSLTGEGTSDDVARICSLLPSIENIPMLEQAAFWYARANFSRGFEDPGETFACVAKGASLMSAERPYAYSQDREHVEGVIAAWTGATLAEPDIGETGDVKSPIFIAGLPRSGTTLVEQILCSHSQVHDGAELGLFRILTQEVGGRSMQALNAFESRGGSLGDLRRLYQNLLKQRFPGDGIVVDKTLDASRNLGLIATLFPDAPIIWLRRDPLDTAWSTFKTWFAAGVSWSWKLADIAQHFNLEDRLFHHWTTVLGEKILPVSYRQLVEKPQVIISSILNHCDLPFETACLSPGNRKRTINTASTVQVRSPINRSGLGTARPFEKEMASFIDIYQGELTSERG